VKSLHFKAFKNQLKMQIDHLTTKWCKKFRSFLKPLVAVVASKRASEKKFSFPCKMRNVKSSSRKISRHDGLKVEWEKLLHNLICNTFCSLFILSMLSFSSPQFHAYITWGDDFCGFFVFVEEEREARFGA
jgi:hypothetical protein